MKEPLPGVEPAAAEPFDIRSVLGLATPVIRVAAVGAMMIGDGDEPHTPLIEKGLCQVIGFEPQRDECDRLNARHGAPHRFLPFAIADGRRRPFHVTNAPPCSSLYPPNDALLRCFMHLPEFFQVVDRPLIETIPLDDVPDLGPIEMLKMDTQGGELDVIQGAAATLTGIVAIHTEICFVPLYEGQAVFGDIDTALRKAGFLFHCFAGAPQARSFRPLVSDGGPFAGTQLLWADAVYVRDFTRLAELKTRQRMALATILHECYRSYDLCAYVLHVQDRIDGSNFWAPYMARLTGKPPSPMD